LNQQTGRYGIVAENALREAGEEAITRLRNKKTSNAAADKQKEATITWIKNRAGIVEKVN